jgi:hypothetical protein
MPQSPRTKHSASDRSTRWLKDGRQAARHGYLAGYLPKMAHYIQAADPCQLLPREQTWWSRIARLAYAKNYETRTRRRALSHANYETNPSPPVRRSRDRQGAGSSRNTLRGAAPSATQNYETNPSPSVRRNRDRQGAGSSRNTRPDAAPSAMQNYETNPSPPVLTATGRKRIALEHEPQSLSLLQFANCNHTSRIRVALDCGQENTNGRNNLRNQDRNAFPGAASDRRASNDASGDAA